MQHAIESQGGTRDVEHARLVVRATEAAARLWAAATALAGSAVGGGALALDVTLLLLLLLAKTRGNLGKTETAIGSVSLRRPLRKLTCCHEMKHLQLPSTASR